MPQETAEENLEEFDESQTKSLEIADEQDKEPKEDETNEAEVNEKEFDDSSDAKEPKEQSKEENAKFAKERREREKTEKLAKEQEESKKRELEKVRFEAIKDTLGGVNPYTGNPIEDELDMKEYLTMREMDKQGLDPIQDYSSFIKQSKRRQAEEEARKIDTKSKEEWIEKDREDFFKEYPKANMEELSKDERFQKFAYGKVGNIPMASIYKDYLELKEEINQEAKKIATRLVANKESSPGSLNDNGETDVNWTIDDIKKMSPEEVHKNYDKILKVLSKK